jgi:hypothetical protein
VNVLERWAEEELPRVPPGPSVDELRRRVRARRARRVGSLAAVAIVLAILGIAALLRSPAEHRVQVTEPTTGSTPTTLPVATTAEFPPLAKIVNSVIVRVHNDSDPKTVARQPSSAEIVATTRGHVDAARSQSEPEAEQPIYFVQLIGDFVCNSCFGGPGYPPRGPAFQLEFEEDGSIGGGTCCRVDDTLRTLGTVYRLPLTRPPATAERFPPLAKMAKIVSNNVRLDDPGLPGSARPTSGELVETPRARAFPLFGGSLANLGEHIYVVQVMGNFTCKSCSRPANAVAPHGRALQVFFDDAGGGYGYGVGPFAYDLSTLGTVYRLPLP